MPDLSFLNQRRSVPARQLGAPGPDAAQLDALLRAAVRVPDHGKLAPWRFLLIRGEARARLGQRMMEIHRRVEPDVAPAALEKDRERFTFAPLIVSVIARLDHHHKVPAQEQLLSAGCVAYNLLLGAQDLGFAAQWLTGWAAYDAEVNALLGLGTDEHNIGFIHIGSVKEPAPERLRPDAASLTSEWTGA